MKVASLARPPETGWETLDQRVLEWLKAKRLRLLGSEIIENCFNRQKRAKANDANKKLELRRAWVTVLDRHVLDSVHGYQEVEFKGEVPTKGVCLESGIQEPSIKSPTSLDMSTLSSKSPRPHWYSVGAPKWPCQ